MLNSNVMSILGFEKHKKIFKCYETNTSGERYSVFDVYSISFLNREPVATLIMTCNVNYYTMYPTIWLNENTIVLCTNSQSNQNIYKLIFLNIKTNSYSLSSNISPAGQYLSVTGYRAHNPKGNLYFDYFTASVNTSNGYLCKVKIQSMSPVLTYNQMSSPYMYYSHYMILLGSDINKAVGYVYNSSSPYTFELFQMDYSTYIYTTLTTFSATQYFLENSQYQFGVGFFKTFSGEFHACLAGSVKGLYSLDNLPNITPYSDNFSAYSSGGKLTSSTFWDVEEINNLGGIYYAVIGVNAVIDEGIYLVQSTNEQFSIIRNCKLVFNNKLKLNCNEDLYTSPYFYTKKSVRKYNKGSDITILDSDTTTTYLTTPVQSNNFEATYTIK